MKESHSLTSNPSPRFPSYWSALLLCFLAAMVIFGCGGGGGGSSSSTSSTSSTSTTSSQASLPANSIVYGIPSSSGATYNVTAVGPTGSSPVTVTNGVTNAVLLYTPNPAVAGQYAFAADPTGAGIYGIYLGTTISTSGGKALVAPSYTDVSSLTISSDGLNLIYSAGDASSGQSYLYAIPLTGGTPIRFGLSDGSTISPADNDTIAYVGPLTNAATIDQVFTRRLSTGANGASTQITTDGNNHTLPAYSRDGKQLAFWEEGTTNSLTILSTATGTSATLPNPNNYAPQAETFSSDGTQVAIAWDTGSGAGQLVTELSSGSGGPSIVASASNLLGNYLASIGRMPPEKRPRSRLGSRYRSQRRADRSRPVNPDGAFDSSDPHSFLSP